MRKFFYTLAYLATIQLFALFVPFAFRLVEYSALHGMIAQADDASSLSYALPFLYGLWTDNIVASYLTAIPLLVLLLAGLLNYYPRVLRVLASLWVCLLYPLVFLLSALNIPYFKRCGANLNPALSELGDSATEATGQAFQQVSFLPFLALFLLSVILFTWGVRHIRRWYCRRIQAARPLPFSWLRCGMQAAISVLVFSLCLLGIRGYVGAISPLPSAAYFSSDPFLNQLGIDPAYSFFSYLLDEDEEGERALRLMPDSCALSYAQKLLAPGADTLDARTLLREIHAQGDGRHQNVVMLFLGDLPASLLQCFGGEGAHTPTLDSLYRHSLAFSRCYAASSQSPTGIIAPLYTFPALGDFDFTTGVTPRRLQGLPTVLRAKGWSTLAFIPSQAQYYRLNAFLRTNGVQTVLSGGSMAEMAYEAGDSPTLRSPFDHILARLSEQANSGQPFFASIHTQGLLPSRLCLAERNAGGAIGNLGSLECLDRAIGGFLRGARQTAWGVSSIFILLADSGSPQSAPHLREANHIPLCIFGAGIAPRLYEGLAQQVDIMPTVLGLLQQTYDYHGFGLDLLRAKRNRIFYLANRQIVGRSERWLSVYDPQGDRDTAYAVLPNGELRGVASTPAVDSLRFYAAAMTQAAQWLRLQP